MKIFVVDVAAESGGALTILNQFRKEFENDFKNKYICVLSLPHYENKNNVKYINLKWTKKTLLHRLWFENYYVKKLIKKENPDLVISLQNKAVIMNDINQEVYFHNALFLSDKRFSFSQSKLLWIYQNIISHMVKRSLKYANKIYVQADWIKEKMHEKWGIDNERIMVKEIVLDNNVLLMQDNVNLKINISNKTEIELFYPANGMLYKNHETLLRACRVIWKECETNSRLMLTLTGSISDLSQKCRKIILENENNVKFCGRISQSEMYEMYRNTILVFPSLIETVGLPLKEAANVGSKIIAADLPYAHEALKEYDDVTYFEAESVNSLVAELKKILEE